LNDVDDKNNIRRVQYNIQEKQTEQKAYDLAVSVPFGVLSSSAGDSVSIVYTVENLQDDIPGSSVIRYYLSSDEVISDQDMLLDTRVLPAIDEGELREIVDTLVIPSNVLAGMYAIFISLEESALTETNTENNQAFIYCELKATGISNNLFSTPTILLYPNPASEILQMKSGKMLDSYQIFNNTGQEVRSAMLNGSKETSIDVAELRSGIYYLLVKSGKQVETMVFELVE
jgi:hypothetical protein